MSEDDRRRCLDAAIRDHRDGRVREAAAAYGQLLQRHPRDADILQRLGVAMAQLGRPDEGVRLMSASLELKPEQPRVLLNLARACLDAQHPDDALRCCDRMIALNAATADVFRLRGTALTKLARQEEALANFGQAVRLSPSDAAALTDLGTALEAAGRSDDALTCFERALELNPGMVPVHHLIAKLHAHRHDHQRALLSIDRALTLAPNDAALHNNRGNSLKELGRLSQAVESYARSLSLEPHLDTLHNRAISNSLLGRHVEAWHDYRDLLSRGAERPGDLVGAGAALLALGRDADALPLLERATAQLPDSTDAHIQYGMALLRQDRHDDAIASFDRALALNRDLPDVINNRGAALAAAGRDSEAIANFIQAGARAADLVEVHTNLGVMFKHVGRYRDAALSFDRALSLRPDDPTASFELAFLHLTMGEFDKGWPLYEARFRVAALAAPARHFSAPRWHGREPIAGRAILIHAEQGLGDAIQFARYLPLLLERGARVIFEVMPQIEALMRSLPSSAIQLIARGQPLPPIDFHCPLLSLPLAFGTRLETIPCTVPYLSAEPERAADWATRLRSLSGLRVGIAWQGNLQVERLVWARGRSMPLVELTSLSRIAGVNLISLQKGPGSEQLPSVPFRDRILDLGQQLDPGADAFLDTAAIVQNLDLVISTDTAIAHLAGALGRPTWVALNASPDWRWLLGREDSPWYPGMRLFRQSARNSGWSGVVSQMTAALSALASQHAAS